MFLDSVPGGGHRNLRVPDLYNLHPTCSEGHTDLLYVFRLATLQKHSAPRVPTRKIAVYVFHLRPAPPRIFECYPRSSELWRHLMHVFLGEGAGAHLPHVFHIFPTCSTRCASVLRVPRLLPLLCAPSTLDADRTRRCAMVAHSPATAAKIVAGLVINMLPGLAIDLHPQNCATVRQGVTSAATHRQEQSQH